MGFPAPDASSGGGPRCDAGVHDQVATTPGGSPPLVAVVVLVAGRLRQRVRLEPADRASTSWSIPTPSPDPADFVGAVDNPWLPLAPGRTWTYDVVDVDGAHRLTRHRRGRSRRSPASRRPPGSAPSRATDDDRLVRPGHRRQRLVVRPRGGVAGRRGRRRGRAGDAGRPRASATATARRTSRASSRTSPTVIALDGSATVPAGSYDDLLVTRGRRRLEPGGSREQSWARDVGLVEERARRPHRAAERDGCGSSSAGRADLGAAVALVAGSQIGGSSARALLDHDRLLDDVLGLRRPAACSAACWACHCSGVEPTGCHCWPAGSHCQPSWTIGAGAGAGSWFHCCWYWSGAA